MRIEWKRPMLDRVVETAKKVEASHVGAELVWLTEKEWNGFMAEADVLAKPIGMSVREFHYKGFSIYYRLGQDWLMVDDTQFQREAPCG